MRIDEGNPGETTTFSPESMTTSAGNLHNDSLAISDPLPPFSRLSIEDCVYRGEGNANVVIALPQERTVIRFRKSLADDVSPDGGKQRAEREVEFVKSVASCFLGSYAQIPEIHRYDMKSITRLSEAIRPLRPDNRRHKEITAIYATKFPDYTFLPPKLDIDQFRSERTFCVEIKPKEGYLGDATRKFQKCPYCMTQYYKLKKKTITTRSTYCPLDLFSGIEERMKAAIKGLVKSPQNNFKIFKNGEIVYDEGSSLNDLERVFEEWFHISLPCTDKGYIDIFCNLICAALLYPLDEEEYEPDAPSAYESSASVQEDFKTTSRMNPGIFTRAKKLLNFTSETCDVKSKTLPNNSVLERILRMQRQSFISTEYIYNVYSKFRPLITDEIVYSNFIGKRKLGGHRLSSRKHTQLTTEYIKTYPKTISESTSILRKSNLEDDCNGNKYINSEAAWSIANDPTNDFPLIAKSTQHAASLEKNNVPCNESITSHNGDHAHSNEKDECCLLNAESIVYLRNYLLFTCARDCSVLITFREVDVNTVPANVKRNVIKLSDELGFLCNIGVTDLDPKSLQCIEKHRQRDINVLNSVISTIEEELMEENQLSTK